MLTVLVCSALFVFMIAMAIWLPRYLSNYMSQPAGKRPTVWLIISLEAVALAFIINIVNDGFQSKSDAPLALPCLGGLLLVGGVSGMFWAGYQLYRLQKLG